MLDYSIYLDSAAEKYKIMSIIRSCGGIITDVSGCAPGYLVCLRATPGQAEKINCAWGNVS